MKFARYTFLGAGLYGLLVVLPQYFLEEKNGRDFPPPITHPEYYYGFVGVTLAWQVLFLFLSADPKRYRPMILPCILEKYSFAVAVTVLFLQNRISALMFGIGMIDGILGALFIAAYFKTALNETKT